MSGVALNLAVVPFRSMAYVSSAFCCSRCGVVVVLLAVALAGAVKTITRPIREHNVSISEVCTIYVMYVAYGKI